MLTPSEMLIQYNSQKFDMRYSFNWEAFNEDENEIIDNLKWTRKGVGTHWKGKDT